MYIYFLFSLSATCFKFIQVHSIGALFNYNALHVRVFTLLEVFKVHIQSASLVSSPVICQVQFKCIRRTHFRVVATTARCVAEFVLVQLVVQAVAATTTTRKNCQGNICVTSYTGRMSQVDRLVICTLTGSRLWKKMRIFRQT